MMLDSDPQIGINSEMIPLLSGIGIGIKHLEFLLESESRLLIHLGNGNRIKDCQNWASLEVTLWPWLVDLCSTLILIECLSLSNNFTMIFESDYHKQALSTASHPVCCFRGWLMFVPLSSLSYCWLLTNLHFRPNFLRLASGKARLI